MFAGPLLVVLAVVLSLVFFGLWIFVGILKMVDRAFNGVRKPVQPLPPINQRFNDQPKLRCRRSNCQTINPPQARFCRRCGVPIAASTVDLRRVAALL